MNKKYVIGECNFSKVFYCKLKENICHFAIKESKNLSFKCLNEPNLLSILKQGKGIPKLVVTVKRSDKNFIITYIKNWNRININIKICS